MLKDILAISGQSGLWKLVSRSTKGIIVENIETGKRIPAFHTSKVSALEDIAIYTEDEEVPLKSIFEKISKIENKGATSINKNSSVDEIKEYFEDVLPNYDKSRVYPSDMKKVLTWYNILLEKDLLNFDEKAEESKDDNSKEEKPVVKEKTEKIPEKRKVAEKTVKAESKKSPSVPKQTMRKKMG